jgi:hypothetical protein
VGHALRPLLPLLVLWCAAALGAAALLAGCWGAARGAAGVLAAADVLSLSPRLPAGALLAHGERLLSAAARIFRGPCCSPRGLAGLARSTSAALSRQLSAGGSSIASRAATSLGSLASAICHQGGRLLNMEDNYLGAEDTADYSAEELSPCAQPRRAQGGAQQAQQAGSSQGLGYSLPPSNTPKVRRGSLALTHGAAFPSSSTIGADASGDFAAQLGPSPSPSSCSLASEPAPDSAAAAAGAGAAAGGAYPAVLSLRSPCASLDGASSSASLAALAAGPKEDSGAGAAAAAAPSAAEQQLPPIARGWEGAATAATLEGSPRGGPRRAVGLTLKVGAAASGAAACRAAACACARPSLLAHRQRLTHPSPWPSPPPPPARWRACTGGTASPRTPPSSPPATTTRRAATATGPSWRCARGTARA